MTKKVLLIGFLILNISLFAQKAQRIGYIDMEYILENLPEYNAAQSQIDAKVVVWQQNIARIQKEIDDMKAELNNEKALLTKDLITEKEEDIQIKELELKKMQGVYFGVNGDLFLLRQQLVKPVQDLVFNAVQDIATKRKYDFVLDKSSDLIMLYSNEDFDISEMVISSITRAQKTAALNSKNVKVENDATPLENEVTGEKSERDLKKEATAKRLADRKAEQLKKREELKKAIEAKRQERIKNIEAAKKAKENKKKNN